MIYCWIGGCAEGVPYVTFDVRLFYCLVFTDRDEGSIILRCHKRRHQRRKTVELEPFITVWRDHWCR